MKGTVIISETLLEAVGIVISFILIVLVVQLVFQQQTQTTYQSAFQAVARDISTAIDRSAAASGSMFIQQDLPKGLKVNVTISYKNIIVSSGSIAARKSFSGLTNTPPVTLINPTTICIVKSQNDNKVAIVSGNCQCNPKDNICDPVCGAQGICDPACSNSQTGVCNPFCIKNNPNVCDGNCYSNYPTGICEVACIQPNVTDGICSPDCENVKKGVCDLDCYNQYSNGNTGYCDPDCPPQDKVVKVGNISVKPSDGHCYTGCINSTISIQSQSNVQSTSCIPANATNWHCLIVSKNNDYNSTNYADYENQIWSCGAFYTSCAGQLCDESNNQVSCHVTKVDTAMFPQAPVCCCVGNNCRNSTRNDCLTSGGDVLDPRDASCVYSSASATPKTNQIKKSTLKSDGICDLDCNATKNICDPDCPNSVACQNICMKEGETSSDNPCCHGLIKCPATNVCSKTCCGNGVCEGRNMWPPGNKTLWETPYTCAADCGNATRPTCNPGGSFTKSVCYRDIGQGTGDRPIWGGDAIKVCDPQAQLFLDRRNWNINEVLQTVKAAVPEGWAFDASRYIDACNRILSAGQTISANENYTDNFPICCSLAGTGCPMADAVYLGQKCAGIGYCADHAAAMLSILRTLGVPDNDVFMTFEIFGQSCGRHAFVVMKCDPTLPANLLPTDCQGHDNEWIRIDATQHFVQLLKDTSCVSMGIWWNDKGIYPLTYGKISDAPLRGYVYPQNAKCDTTGQPTEDDCKNSVQIEHHFDDLCQPYNVECVVPS
jgi:hypothetical protein